MKLPIFRVFRIYGKALATLALIAALGCGAGTTPRAIDATASSTPTRGNVHGGQQPVSGATIQVWAMGTTGDGSASTPLLTQSVQSDANGNFTLTGLYSCADTDQVYVTGTEGDPGLGTGVNHQIALMVAPGTCAQLKSMSSISINELTTVASVSELAPWMLDMTHIGSSAADLNTVALAVADAAILVDPASGNIPATTPAGTSFDAKLLNTLADAMASCVNSSGGVYGDLTPCGQYFAASVASTDFLPANTIEAQLSIQDHPTFDPSGILDVVTPSSPFEPVDATAPASLLVFVNRATLTATYGAPQFYTVVMGASRSYSVTLKNTSTLPAYLSGSFAAQSSTDITVASSTCGGTLSAGKTCAYKFTYMPTTFGTATASYLVTDGGPSAPLSLALLGNSAPITVTPDFMPAGKDVERLVWESAYTATITNTSTRTVSLTYGLANGIYPNIFTGAGTCGATLLAESSCSVDIAWYYTGICYGDRTANITDTTDNMAFILVSVCRTDDFD